MYEISKEEIKISKHLLKKKRHKTHSKTLICVSIFHYYLGPVNAYVKLYSLNPNPGELVHSIEWSFRKGQFSSQVSRTKCTGVTCRERTNSGTLRVFSHTYHDEPALSAHHHECLFLFTLDKIVPLTFQSSFIQAYESITSHPSFWDHHWPPVLCPRTHLLLFCSDLVLLHFSRERSMAIYLGKIFPLGRKSCFLCVTKGEAFRSWGWRTNKTAWCWGSCDNFITLWLSYGALFNPVWNTWVIGQGRPVVEPAACLFLFERL